MKLYILNCISALGLSITLLDVQNVLTVLVLATACILNFIKIFKNEK